MEYKKLKNNSGYVLHLQKEKMPISRESLAVLYFSLNILSLDSSFCYNDENLTSWKLPIFINKNEIKRILKNLNVNI